MQCSNASWLQRGFKGSAVTTRLFVVKQGVMHNHQSPEGFRSVGLKRVGLFKPGQRLPELGCAAFLDEKISPSDVFSSIDLIRVTPRLYTFTAKL